MNKFSYLANKIKESEFSAYPFKHLYIKDFLSDEHFKRVVKSSDIDFSRDRISSDEALISKLKETGYKAIDFPGCFVNEREYIDWRKGKNGKKIASSCEGAGMTFRLNDFSDLLLKELSEYLKSEEFNKAIAEKFEINFSECRVDHGIHKYLDGYEISPHPDIRSKAATYMLNLNSHEKSETFNHHTHYMVFNEKYKYVREFWKGNKEVNRGWVPWDWCETVLKQEDNNSIVIFSPNDETLHAVRADYDHFIGQRTQAYGNLWFKDRKPMPMISWEELDISAIIKKREKNFSLSNIVKAKIPKIIKENIKNKMADKKSLKPKDNLD